MYPTRFYPIGDHSEAKKSLSKSMVDDIKAKISLPKLIEGHVKAKMGLLATIVDFKYISLVYKSIFLKHLYIIL